MIPSDTQTHRQTDRRTDGQSGSQSCAPAHAGGATKNVNVQSFPSLFIDNIGLFRRLQSRAPDFTSPARERRSNKGPLDLESSTLPSTAWTLVCPCVCICICLNLLMFEGIIYAFICIYVCVRVSNVFFFFFLALI